MANTDMTEAQKATRDALKSYKTLEELGGALGIAPASARSRVQALSAAGYTVESRPRVIEREAGQRGRNPHEFKVTAAPGGSKPKAKKATAA